MNTRLRKCLFQFSRPLKTHTIIYPTILSKSLLIKSWKNSCITNKNYWSVYFSVLSMCGKMFEWLRGQKKVCGSFSCFMLSCKAQLTGGNLNMSQCHAGVSVWFYMTPFTRCSPLRGLCLARYTRDTIIKIFSAPTGNKEGVVWPTGIKLHPSWAQNRPAELKVFKVGN